MDGTFGVVASAAPVRNRARGFGQRVVAAMPGALECVATLCAIGALLPLFATVSHWDAGRDDRFLDRGIEVAGLPEPALDATCRAVGALAEPSVRTALCTGLRLPTPSPASTVSWPPTLALALDRTTDAFAAPVRAFDRARTALSSDARAGTAELRPSGDAIGALEADLDPYLRRYRLSFDAAGPAPLQCARAWVDGQLSMPAAPAPAEAHARADAFLLLAAALDGRASAAALAADATTTTPVRSGSPCPGIVESLADTAAVMAGARQADARARKNAATRDLAAHAGLQWAVAMALGFGFLRWSRRTRHPALGAGVALLVWAVAGWAARVPSPFSGSHGFDPARADAAWLAVPGGVTGVAALLGLSLVAVSLLGARRAAAATPDDAPQAMSSRVGYAGFVVLTGIGALLLLDLSFNGHPGNRYLALYHQGHLWLAATLLSVLLFFRRGLSGALAWALSLAAEAHARGVRAIGAPAAAALLVAAAAAGVLAVAFALANVRQLTSELGRVWLIGGAAWFFFLRGGPMTEQLARSGSAGRSFVRYAWPMLFVVGVLVAAMFATHDMGPLLIAGYASGAFVAATLAMWWHHRSGNVATAVAAAVLLFAAWIAAVTAALFRVGAYDGVTASRLESVGRAVRVGQRPAGPRVVVPAGHAGRRLRARHDAVVRVCRRPLQRRAGADPQRLHLHGDGRRVRARRGVGAVDRRHAVAAPPHPPPRSRHARRAAPAAAGRPPRARRAGAGELDRRRLGRARVVPARGHGRGQPRGAAADRRDVPVRQLRHDLAAGEHRVPRAVPERRRAGGVPTCVSAVASVPARGASSRCSTARSWRAPRWCR